MDECPQLENLHRALRRDQSPGVLVETARALEAHGWRFGRTTRQTLVLATLHVERRYHMTTETDAERERALLS